MQFDHSGQNYTTQAHTVSWFTGEAAVDDEFKDIEEEEEEDEEGDDEEEGKKRKKVKQEKGDNDEEEGKNEFTFEFKNAQVSHFLFLNMLILFLHFPGVHLAEIFWQSSGQKVR